MGIKLSSRSVTPLIEMLIVLFFFAFVCTVVLEMFAASDRNSRLASDINEAVLLAEDSAERLKGRSLEFLNETYRLPGFERAGGDVFTCRYDRDWRPSASGGAAYVAELRLSREESGSGVAVKGKINVYRVSREAENTKRDILTQLDFFDYFPR